MYAWVNAEKLNAKKRSGIYRSDDAGESWQQVNDEERVWGRGDDFGCVRVDPRNKDVIYVANTSTYRSTDAGKNFTAIKGAPGGDDYHTIWINPENPDIIALAVDQGATISVNGGQTWSSWYNQPTAQFYHVITDNEFPYWVYGGQQESGSVGTASRSDFGEITFRDWTTIGVEEYGYVAPDPLHPNLIYGGKVTVFDRNTGQTRDVSPVVLRTEQYRFNRTAPLIFSAVDPHVLYLGSNVLFETRDGGNSWQIISPDLTREDPGVPATLGPFIEADPAKGKHRGVIYSIAPSPKDVNLIWAGTDDGLIQVTHDGGKNWQNVTPHELTPWSKLAQMDASHFDTPTAYAAVNRFRLDDLHPYIYRTHDGGNTWQNVVSGLPDNEPVNTVREDLERKGLLFAGTERTVYVSWDDGDHWQSLKMNLPPTSIRDLVVHHDDVVVGTHGRSFWILDNITPLRQFSPELASAPAHLFAPQFTYRVRRNNNTDTLAKSRSLRRGYSGDCRYPIRTSRAPLFKRRQARAGRREETQRSNLLGASSANFVRRAGDASLRLGPDLSRARRAHSRLPYLGYLSRHAALSARSHRVARALSSRAHSWRQELYAAAEHSHGSAREDFAGKPGQAIRTRPENCRRPSPGLRSLATIAQPAGPVEIARWARTGCEECKAGSDHEDSR